MSDSTEHDPIHDEQDHEHEHSQSMTLPEHVTDEHEPSEIATGVEDVPAADGATVMESLSTERAADVAEYLDPVTAAEIMSEMDPTLAASVITDMEPADASMVLAEMDPDDRVDILEHIPGPLHEQLISEMDAPDAADTRRLEQYPPDTAGGIMTTAVTSLKEDLTVEQAVAELRRLNEQYEQLFYVYVVDQRNHLVGVLSMRDLILAPPGTTLSRVMRPQVASVPATMDQEEVARLVRRYNYLAMPVVDDHHRLVGLVTVDDVVDVLEEEATEDVQKLFGAGAEERLNSPWSFSFRKRVWWLEVNLATAFLAAAVVGAYDQLIKQMPILAAYMPIVAGMGGNASAQAMSVSIRGIAVGKVDRNAMRKVLFRELLVGLTTGLVIGITTASISMITHLHDATLSQTVALAMVLATALLINHTLACVSGAGIPFIMKRLGFDPAQSATIFATTITDVAGFFCLLGLAQTFIGWLK